MNRIVVVGAAAGGLAAAEALRGSGYAGHLTLVGQEPRLPYDRPPLSKQVLTGEWPPERTALRGSDDLEALHLDLRLGHRATALDPGARTVTLADGTRLPYDGLVIATGVRPRRLPGTLGLPGVHTLRTLDDALGLRERLGPGRRLVIIGAGFLGAEAAAVARTLGTDVTLLETASVPLAGAVGSQVGRFLAEVHHDNGVRLRTSVTVTGVRHDEHGVSGVALGDGSVVPADDVLVAIGSLPNAEWLDGSGLAVRDGLVCDMFSAAAPGVYGVGDVASWHNPLFGRRMRVEHRTNAAEQGMAAARNLLAPGRGLPFAPVPYFWSDQYGLKIQAYGWLRDHDEAVVVDGDTGDGRFLVAYRRDARLVGALAVGMPPKALRGWRSLIGAGTAWGAALTGAAA